jgi:hypothetical protein
LLLEHQYLLASLGYLRTELLFLTFHLLQLLI